MTLQTIGLWFSFIIVASRVGAVVSGPGVSMAQFNNPVPTITSANASPGFLDGNISYMEVVGTGSISSSIVTWNGTPLPTTMTPTGRLLGAGPPPGSSPGPVTIRVANPLPGGGISNSHQLNIPYPIPYILSMSPNSTIAGGPGLTLVINGLGFYPYVSSLATGTTLRVDGIVLPYVLNGSTQMTVQLPASLLANAGSVVVSVVNPAFPPIGGGTDSVTFNRVPPTLSSLNPTSITPLTANAGSLTVSLVGQDFLPSAVAYADGILLPTTYISSTLLQAAISPSIPGTLIPGGIAISVENAHYAASRAIGLQIGNGRNQGTISRFPLAPSPGEAFNLWVATGRPGAPVVLIADQNPGPPLTGVPNAITNLTLSVRLFGTSATGWHLVNDSIGVFGTPFGWGTAPDGTFYIDNIVLPNPPAGATFTSQAAYLDPTSPIGIRLTWARFPDAY